MAVQQVVVLVIVAALVAPCYATPPGYEKLSFQSPEQTDEESLSETLPEHMICDACQAVVYQIKRNLKKAEELIGNKPLKESKYLEVLEEDTCGKSFENYGLKPIDGQNVLSGPGLWAEKTPGVMAGGGKWPHRLKTKCLEILGDFGEDEIYQWHRDGDDLSRRLCKRACRSDTKYAKKGRDEL